ncbi:MAG TPA: aquaporin family protein [Bacteroidetes bacterium]|nr:aquaporin family protein [Bacteroidota bacterium]HIL58301.1 aquaporin family protein [Rhodothermales bacterium]
MTPYIAEFVGTALLLLLGDGVVANVILKGTKGEGAGWITITWGWGMAVFVAVFVTAAYSGAHINPAVTIGLAVAGKFAWAMVPGYIIAQVLGAMAGAFLVWLQYRSHFDITEDPDTQLAVFATGPAIRDMAGNVISEVIGTFVLVFGVLYLAAPSLAGPNGDPGGLGALDALPVGLLVLVIGLSLGGTTGYAINPARDLGPRIMHALLPMKGKGSSDWGYAWIPVVAPIVGAVLAALAYFVLGSEVPA